MRKVAAIIVTIASFTVIALMLAPVAGATHVAAPQLQATAAPTAAATTAATTAATSAATAAATTAATSAATAAATTTTPGALPQTGGDSGLSIMLAGLAALVILGVAATILLSSRRNVR
jgi:LPXTG-motif cell wall-anchored protein